MPLSFSNNTYKKYWSALIIIVSTLLLTGCSAESIRKSETLAVFETVAISPDGKYIAAGKNSSNIIFIYEAQSLKIVRYLIGSNEINFNLSIKSIDFSPDGKFLATAGINDDVSIWNVNTGKLIKSFPDLTKANDVAYSPDRKRLAVVGPDTNIRLIDLSSGLIDNMTQQHTGAVLAVGYSPDGKLIFSGGEDHNIIVWSVDSKQRIATYSGHTLPVESLAISPSGDELISVSRTELKKWQILSHAHLEDLFNLNESREYEEDAQTIEAVYNVLRVVNFLHLGYTTGPANIRATRPLSVDYSADGRYLVYTFPHLTWAGDLRMSIFDFITKDTTNIDGQFFALAVHPTDGYVVTAGQGIHLYDLASGKEIRPNPL